MTAPNPNCRKVVRLTAQPGAADAMRTALIDLRTATIAEPGCVEFEFLQSLTDAEAFVLIEDFASAEALEAHMQAPHTKGFFAKGLLARGAPIERSWLS